MSKNNQDRIWVKNSDAQAELFLSVKRRNAAVMKKWGQKHTLLLYTILFFLVALCGYLVLFKDGRSTVYASDGLGQYYPAFLYIGQYVQEFFRNLLRGTPAFPLFDLSIGMGEDVIGVLNYYGFGDPLNLLAVFVTKENSAWLFTVLFFLRLWLAGIAFRKYCDVMRLDRVIAAFGALCYVFSGFAIYGGAMYSEWASVLIYFPLMLLGVEKLFRPGGKPYALVFAVAYGALCGFYFLYMCSLALGLYCAVRLIALYGVKNRKVIVQRCIHCLLWYCLGIFLAAPFLFPALQAFLGSERSGSNIFDIICDVRNYIPHGNDKLGALLYDAFPDGRNYLLGIGPLQVTAVFLLLRMRGSRSARQLRCAVAIALVGLHLPITDYLFNAFGESNDRWVFLIQFFLAVVVVFAVSCVKRADTSHTEKKLILGMVYILAPLQFTAVIWNVFLSDGGDWIENFIRYDDCAVYVDSPYCYSDILQEDTELFRVSNDSLTGINGRPENVAMLHDYHGLTYWFSMINGNVQTCVNQWMDAALNWRSYGFDHIAVYETFSGVKYDMRNDNGAVADNFRLADTVSFHGQSWHIYENEDYFGLACVRDRRESQRLWEEADGYADYYSALLGQIGDNHEVTALTYDKSTNHITCEVNVEAGAELLVLIPYSENWRAAVDGEAVEIRRTDIMYMAVMPDAPGEHEIRITYHNTAFTAGMICMAAAAAILFLYQITFLFSRTILHNPRAM